MYPHKYGEFADMQISEIKEVLRKRIFFLLLVAEDYKINQGTKYPEINLMQANTTLLWRISGLNDLLGNPLELVTVLSLLEEPKNIIPEDLNFATFNYAKYRKLILDAGAEIMKIVCPPEKQGANNAPSE